jgi:hypothetical protein
MQHHHEAALVRRQIVIHCEESAASTGRATCAALNHEAARGVTRRGLSGNYHGGGLKETIILWGLATQKLRPSYKHSKITNTVEAT